MPFTRTVEIGRVAMVNYGPDYGKLVVIVDVLDMNRVVVDHPSMTRCIGSLKRLSITDMKLEVSRLAKRAELAKACEGLEATFGATAWGKKHARMVSKAAMTDFDRYKAMVVKCKRARLVRKAFNQLKKSA